jgi:AcrR family transcriptional regulator
MPARKSHKRVRSDAEQLKQQILDAFSANAKRHGIRSVMMAELATELRMSASTLYKLYPSKEALALACVERWAGELGAAEAAESGPRDGFERFMHWVDAWADANARLSPAFRRDLQTDYPSVWRRYRQEIRVRKERGAALLRPVLKPGIDERVAFAVLNMIFEEVLKPELAEKLRITRHELIRTAVTIWAAGAVDRRGKLRAIKTENKTEGKKR